MPRFTKRKGGQYATAHVKVHIPEALFDWACRQCPVMPRGDVWAQLVRVCMEADAIDGGIIVYDAGATTAILASTCDTDEFEYMGSASWRGPSAVINTPAR